MADRPQPRYGTLNLDYVATWRDAPTDEPMWALNLMHYREKADYLDGRDDDITGWEADNRYSPIEPIMRIGGSLALVAIVVDQPTGDDVRWDRIAIVKYPYRSALAEMDATPEFQAAHVHKDAGMARTICAATFPQPDTINRAAIDVPDAGQTQLVMQVVADAATPSLDIDGAVPVATFDVEGVVIGDGRTWAEARWWLLPSGSVEALQAAAAAATSESDQYVTLLKPQFGDFLELLAAH
jgi:hypothetical protein